MKCELRNNRISIVADSVGGELISIKDLNGIEYLWQGSEEYWTGQSPVLFPICGSLRNNEAKVGGDKKCFMPRHGIARKNYFTVTRNEENLLAFRLDSNDTSLKSFPYKWSLEISYILMHYSIEITYSIKNQDTVDMPFFIGGHPAFNCPINSEGKFTDYFLEFEEEETIEVPTIIKETGLIDMNRRMPFLKSQRTIDLSYDLFKMDSLVLDGLKSKSVILRSKVKTLARDLKLSFEDFKYLVLWVPRKDTPFIALEPWTGLSTCSDESDIFEEKRNVKILKPGYGENLRFLITLEEGY